MKKKVVEETIEQKIANLQLKIDTAEHMIRFHPQPESSKRGILRTIERYKVEIEKLNEKVIVDETSTDESVGIIAT